MILQNIIFISVYATFRSPFALKSLKKVLKLLTSKVTFKARLAMLRLCQTLYI